MLKRFMRIDQHIRSLCKHSIQESSFFIQECHESLCRPIHRTLYPLEADDALETIVAISPRYARHHISPQQQDVL